MTRTQYQILEAEAIRERANNCCEVCGKHIASGERAHIIGNTKPNLNRFGWQFLDSRYNLKWTCLTALGNQCNSKAELGMFEGKIEEHVKLVYENLGEKF